MQQKLLIRKKLETTDEFKLVYVVQGILAYDAQRRWVGFSALTLLVGRQEGHPACKKSMWGWRRWALVSPDGLAPSRMVSVSASVNLPLHHKVH